MNIFFLKKSLRGSGQKSLKTISIFYYFAPSMCFRIELLPTDYLVVYIE